MIAHALVVALGVVVLDVLVDHMPEMTFSDDDQVIEALGLDREHEALGIRVQVGFGVEDARGECQLIGAGLGTPA